MSNVSTRLVRLLNMVPYFQANPRVSHTKAAADLGVTPTHLSRVCNWEPGPGGPLCREIAERLAEKDAIAFTSDSRSTTSGITAVLAGMLNDSTVPLKRPK